MMIVIAVRQIVMADDPHTASETAGSAPHFLTERRAVGGNPLGIAPALSAT
jgi:hypothetical protein